MRAPLALNRPLNTLSFRKGLEPSSLGSARPYYLVTRCLGGCASIIPHFYKQRYEEYTNNATKIDVWAVFVDELQTIWIAWRKPRTMKNTRGEFEGGRQPHLIKK